jgi:hypothetical protein
VEDKSLKVEDKTPKVEDKTLKVKDKTLKSALTILKKTSQRENKYVGGKNGSESSIYSYTFLYPDMQLL